MQDHMEFGFDFDLFLDFLVYFVSSRAEAYVRNLVITHVALIIVRLTLPKTVASLPSSR